MGFFFAWLNEGSLNCITVQLPIDDFILGL